MIREGGGGAMSFLCKENKFAPVVKPIDPPPPRIIWCALCRSVNRYPADDLISSKMK